MNWLEIEQLLKRFWDGETSIAEEKELKDAFSRSDVPTHLGSYKSYFEFVENKHKIKHPQENLEVELLEVLQTYKKPLLRLPNVLAYAAGLLLLLSSLFFLLDNNDSLEYKPLTVEEMQLAQKYMGLLAKNIEHSRSFSAQNLEKLNLINRGAQKIQHYETTYSKQLNNLNRIEYIDHSFTQLKYLKTFENNKIKL